MHSSSTFSIRSRLVASLALLALCVTTDPVDADPRTELEWWAFRARGPAGGGGAGARAGAPQNAGAELDLDRFIAERLAEAELQPAPPATKAAFLRRASFGLIGLPPTADEIEAFLEDDSPDAYQKVVDRLLASPHYGERQARHWLDIARYADSNGLDENVAHGNAWRFRDYVIDAFQNDTPYDEFVIEQIAGDLLAKDAPDDEDKRRHLIATGFLSFGPKVLTEADPLKLEMDIIDEQIDTIGKAILGLTIGCARCHDHKYDPISSEDYYGLAAIFKGTRTMRSFKKLDGWLENPLPGLPEVEVKTKKGTERKAPTAMGAMERETVAKLHISLRGDPNRPGKEVPRAVPEFLALVTTGAVEFPAKSSGRLELARWMVSPKNPLTPRVIVNRVWRWQFGRGLVDSTDNFGVRGAEPSHPELLDALAASLMQNAWSLKSLQRRMLLSRTYRASSRAPALADEIDPDNRLLSHFPLTRLDAESLRDAILATSGELNRSFCGSLLTHVKNRGYLFDHTSKDTTSYDSKRRSIYLPVIRNHLFDAFQLFDYPDPNVTDGNRATTTTAPQSLYLLNSEFVQKAAEKIAARTKSAPSARERIRELYRVTLLRSPSDREIDRGVQLIERLESRPWETLAHALLVSNEFVYPR